MTFWDDLAARARGLGAGLLEPAALERLAAAPDPARLAAGLRGTPYALFLPAPRPTSTELEAALRGRAAFALRILGRWAGPGRLRALTPLFVDEDRRSLRVLLRGAAGGLPDEERARGLLPTPGLPPRRLEEASRVGGLGSLAALFSGWDHPLARAVAPAAAAEALRPVPDLYRMEAELGRAWATHSRESAGRGDPLVRQFVREALDEANVATAATYARSPAGSREAVFLEGGSWLDARAFREAVEAQHPEDVERRLRGALSGTPLGGLPDPGTGVSLEEALLSRAVGRWKRRARLYPVGPAPVVHFWLRLRRESTALRRIVWGGALGAPTAARLPRAES